MNGNAERLMNSGQQISSDALSSHIGAVWDRSIIPTLCDFVRIPNKSPMFDPQWERNGHMEKAVLLLADWCRRQPLKGLTVEIARLPGRTPLLFIEIPGTTADTVLMYGHFDKQPKFTGWKEGFSPWEPVIRDGKLYGRGGADDGYAVFSSLTALAALQAQGMAHARCVLLIEGCEESGSFDLPFHVDALAARIGQPDLVICLDAECADYDRLWMTTSLRGNIIGTLNIQMLTEGVHSGSGSGIAASCFDVLRQLLMRVSNPATGELLQDLYVEIPTERLRQAAATAAVLGDSVRARMPFASGVQAVSDTPVELILNSTWRPTLVVTGIDGLPAVRDAGNVLVPSISVKLSFRLPPTGDPDKAQTAIRRALATDPPCNARLSLTLDGSAGWNAPATASWLENAAQEASRQAFGREAMAMGTGGTIPFMGMLGEKFPDTQFMVTGVLGPQSNAHGPNEFLHIDYAKRLTAAVAQVIAAHARAR
jgi:acetylornithine deacetylase/succinyl-diaminopimelate desuccinylase-like protein